jgi:hypothetical protein
VQQLSRQPCKHSAGIEQRHLIPHMHGSMLHTAYMMLQACVPSVFWHIGYTTNMLRSQPTCNG